MGAENLQSFEGGSEFKTSIVDSEQLENIENSQEYAAKLPKINNVLSSLGDTITEEQENSFRHKLNVLNINELDYISKLELSQINELIKKTKTEIKLFIIQKQIEELDKIGMDNMSDEVFDDYLELTEKLELLKIEGVKEDKSKTEEGKKEKEEEKREREYEKKETEEEKKETEEEKKETEEGFKQTIKESTKFLKNVNGLKRGLLVMENMSGNDNVDQILKIINSLSKQNKVVEGLKTGGEDEKLKLKEINKQIDEGLKQIISILKTNPDALQAVTNELQAYDREHGTNTYIEFRESILSIDSGFDFESVDKMEVVIDRTQGYENLKVKGDVAIYGDQIVNLKENEKYLKNEEGYLLKSCDIDYSKYEIINTRINKLKEKQQQNIQKLDKLNSDKDTIKQKLDSIKNINKENLNEQQKTIIKQLEQDLLTIESNIVKLSEENKGIDAILVKFGGYKDDIKSSIQDKVRQKDQLARERLKTINNVGIDIISRELLMGAISRLGYQTVDLGGGMTLKPKMFSLDNWDFGLIGLESGRTKEFLARCVNKLITGKGDGGKSDGEKPPIDLELVIRGRGNGISDRKKLKEQLSSKYGIIKGNGINYIKIAKNFKENEGIENSQLKLYKEFEAVRFINIDKKEEVKKLQGVLNKIGFNLDVDGEWTIETEKAYNIAIQRFIEETKIRERIKETNKIKNNN